jgi:hypothetical protein
LTYAIRAADEDFVAWFPRKTWGPDDGVDIPGQARRSLKEEKVIELDTSDGAPIRFELDPIQRLTRKRQREASEASENDALVEITTPLMTPLTSKLAAPDNELAAFWKAESGRFKYDYITFRTTFMPTERSRFERAWIEIQLDSEKGNEGPIAWSLAPDQIVDITKLTSTAKIGGKFQLLKAEMGAEVGKEAKEYVLRAWREHTSAPFWELTRTDTTILAGTFRLHLIVRSPANTQSTGQISARAVIGKKTFWIVTSDPAAPLGNAVEFTLPK